MSDKGSDSDYMYMHMGVDKIFLTYHLLPAKYLIERFESSELSLLCA